jgi:hypothetical protein
MQIEFPTTIESFLIDLALQGEERWLMVWQTRYHSGNGQRFRSDRFFIMGPLRT